MSSAGINPPQISPQEWHDKVMRKCQESVEIKNKFFERYAKEIGELSQKINDLRDELQEVREKAALDPLTQLFNRAALDAHLDRVADLRYEDAVPRGMLDLLLAYAGKHRTRQPDMTALTLDPTYETAARCLLKWFNEKFRAPRG